MLPLGGAAGRGQHQAEAELEGAGAHAEDREPRRGALRPRGRVEHHAVRPADDEGAGHGVHVAATWSSAAEKAPAPCPVTTRASSGVNHARFRP